MSYSLQIDVDPAPFAWLAPYAWSVVLVGFALFVVHWILRFLQYRFDFLWYRQGFILGSLPLSRKRILQQSNTFYNRLHPKHKVQFEKRVHRFIRNKEFVPRYGQQIDEEVMTILAGEAIKLTFGRRRYLFPNVDRILVYPEPFSSPVNRDLHKGEFNPAQRLLAMSWPDVQEGVADETDNLNLALHEFMHCLHFEADHSNAIDAVRFKKFEQKILQRLSEEEVRGKLQETQFFRQYAYTNAYEFMAVLAEHLFESPQLFKQQLPEMYAYMLKLLNFREEWLQPNS